MVCSTQHRTLLLLKLDCPRTFIFASRCLSLRLKSDDITLGEAIRKRNFLLSSRHVLLVSISLTIFRIFPRISSYAIFRVLTSLTLTRSQTYYIRTRPLGVKLLRKIFLDVSIRNSRRLSGSICLLPRRNVNRRNRGLANNFYTLHSFIVSRPNIGKIVLSIVDSSPRVLVISVSNRFLQAAGLVLVGKHIVVVQQRL